MSKSFKNGLDTNAIQITGGAPGSGKVLQSDGSGNGTWQTPSGTGNMNTSTYDPATIAQQVVGTTATQTLTNKTLTAPSLSGSITEATYSKPVLAVVSTSSAAVNYIGLGNAATGATPKLTVGGTDTNISLELEGKGTGIVKAGGVQVADISSSQTLTNKNLTSGTNTFPTLNQSTTGSAATLTTARTINGVSFNGSANITVADSTKVPTTTTVNGHALSANVTVSQTDVGLSNVNNTSDATKLSATLQAIYPVGAPYISFTSSTSPATVLGFGTWIAVGGYTLVGYKSGDSNFGATGVVAAGEATHTLTAAESGLPAHNHIFSDGGVYYVGGGGTQAWPFMSGASASLVAANTTNNNTAAAASAAHNNIQPSYVVYMWYRSA